MLDTLDGEIEALKSDFESKWINGTFPGWGAKDSSSSSSSGGKGALLSQSGTRLDLSAFSSPEELMSLGEYRTLHAFWNNALHFEI